MKAHRRAGQKFQPWRIEEIAFVLTHADYCIANGVSYYDTLNKDFAKISNRQVSYKVVYDQLRKFFQQKCHVRKPNIKRYTEKGTSYIKMPAEWIPILNEQRKRCGLQPLTNEQVRSKKPHADDILQDDVSSLDRPAQDDEQGPAENVISDATQQSSAGSTTISHRAVPTEDCRPDLDRNRTTPRPVAALNTDDEKTAVDNKSFFSTSSSASSNMAKTLDLQFQSEDTANVAPCQNSRTFRGVPNSAEPLSSTEGPNNVDTNIVFEFIRWLMKRFEQSQGVTSDESSRLTSISRTIQQDGQSAFGKVVEDLINADKAKSEYKNHLKRLLGDRSYLEEPCVLPVPSTLALQRDWNIVRDCIRMAVVASFEEEPTTSSNLGIFAEHVDMWLQKLSLGDMQEVIKWASCELTDIEAKRTPALILMSCLTCYRLFLHPHALLKDFHNEKISHIYEIIKVQGGIEAVKRMDLIATKQLFHRGEALIKRMSRTASVQFEHDFRDLVSLGLDPHMLTALQTCFERAIRLSLDLILSPGEYRVMLCKPGTTFDSRWMEAEDENGNTIAEPLCRGRFVGACLFPALTSWMHETLPQEGDVNAALASNKRFLATDSERTKFGLDPFDVISKSVVLLDRSTSPWADA